MNQIQTLVNYINSLKLLDNLKIAAKYKHQDLVSVIVDVIFSYDEDNQRDTHNTIYNFRKYFNVDQDFKVSDFLDQVETMTTEEIIEKIFKTNLMTQVKAGVPRALAVIEWAKILRKHKIETIDDVINLYANNSTEKEMLKVNGQEHGITFRNLLQIAGDDMFIKAGRYQIDFVNDALDKILDSNQVIILLREATKVLNAKHPGIQLKDLDYAIWLYMQKTQASRFPNEIRNLKRPPKKNKIVKIL